jgi:hypothetical protein
MGNSMGNVYVSNNQQLEEKLQNSVMSLCGKSQIDLAIVEDTKSVFRAFTSSDRTCCRTRTRYIHVEGDGQALPDADISSLRVVDHSCRR